MIDKNNIKTILKNTGIGSGIGALAGVGLGGYLGYEYLNPNELDFNNMDVNPEELEKWNNLTPEQQHAILTASSGIYGGAVGGLLGAGLGASYGIGKLNNKNKKSIANKDIIDAEIIKESISYLNENAIISIAQIIEEASKKSNIEIKHPGAFTKWCKQQGFEGVTCECIKKGLASDNPHVRKMANFARNFGHPECK